MNVYLKGIVCANITPFHKDRTIDYNSVKRLVRYLIDIKLDAIYPLGTNGEGIALTIDEKMKIAELTVEEAQNKIPVVIQCGAKTFEETMALVKHSMKIGAKAVGVMTPFFFNQTQKALEEYYDQVLDDIGDYPLFVYNIPTHTNNDILPQTVNRLALKHNNFVGIKYSHPDILRLSEYISAKEDFNVLIGNDRLIYAAMSIGGAGAVSGPAVIFPDIFNALKDAIYSGDKVQAKRIQKIISDIEIKLSKYQSIPLIKVYLKSIGIIDESLCRIPFGHIDDEEAKSILNDIKQIKSTYKI